jgi:tetratricopeptide (TPR) repeat protein
MTNRRVSRPSALLLAFFIVVGIPATVQAQDVLSRAKGHYASAEYEEALQLLETMKGRTGNTEAAAYQVFCLMALGRRDEARAAIEAIVRTDPLFRPSVVQASPRIRAFFDDVRKPLLSEVTRQSYARGKAAFDRKDWEPALMEFDRVIALLDELGDADQGAADLRTLASGFRDLARAALKPAAAAVPPPAPTPTPAPAPKEPEIYGDEDANVLRPVALSKRLPQWRPSIIEERTGASFSGTLELVISEQGKVLSATLLQKVHPRYDGPLVQAAKGWKFQPATKDGVPVKYRYTLVIRLQK